MPARPAPASSRGASVPAGPAPASAAGVTAHTATARSAAQSRGRARSGAPPLHELTRLAPVPTSGAASTGDASCAATSAAPLPGAPSLPSAPPLPCAPPPAARILQLRRGALNCCDLPSLLPKQPPCHLREERRRQRMRHATLAATLPRGRTAQKAAKATAVVRPHQHSQLRLRGTVWEPVHRRCRIGQRSGHHRATQQRRVGCRGQLRRKRRARGAAGIRKAVREGAQGGG